MERLVLTVGTWDVPHMGHAIFLKRASLIGPLVVGINTDDYVARYKGKKPIFSLSERRYLVEMLGFAVGTVENNQDDLLPLLKEVKPKFLVIGSDWGDRYFEQIGLNNFQLNELGITMLYLPYTKEISTTLIKERCK